jgi:hypothetical protein
LACHRKHLSHHQMAHFWPGVPSQTSFSLSDGKFPAWCAIANALSCFRWHIFGRAYHHKLLFNYQMVNFRPDVPLQASFSSSDGIFPSRLTVANILLIIRW